MNHSEKHREYKVPLMKGAFMYEKETRKALAQFILSADKLSMGQTCEKFETAFALKQGRKHAILFNSGGSANLAMIQALKNLGRIPDGSKIGFSAVTWSTNVMPIIQLGFEAIPLDCDIRTLNCMSETVIPQLEKEACSTFFITNVLGFAGDLDKIEKECEKKNIIVLEDNCEALGTEMLTSKSRAKHTRRTGNFSLASSFSFFVAHHISTIEGGMVCTDDSEFAEMLKIVRANGWLRNIPPHDQVRWKNSHGSISDFHDKYTFYDLGYNLRPTEITGAIGLIQLKYWDEIAKKRCDNFERISKALEKNDDFILADRHHIKTLPAFAIPFVLKTSKLREVYADKFTKAGIEIRPLVAGNMQYQPFFKKYQKRMFKLPGADILHNNAFYCGNCPDYTENEIRAIINCLKPVKISK